MRCSVVIPCHGGASLTAACVRSLLRQTGDHELEILLVDNASPDDTGSLGSLHPCVRVLPQPRNLGFAGGVNRGLHAARHPFLLVLNNDTQAATDLLTRLHRALQHDDRIGVVAPVSNHVKGNAWLPVGHAGGDDAVREEIAAALAASWSGVVQDESTLSGLCLLLPRAVWQAVGDFDERFGNGNFEDDDFCLRARLAGYRLVIARDAFLHHEGHRTFQALGLDYRAELQQRRGQFIAKWSHDAAGAAWIADLHGDLAAAGALAERALRQHPQWPDASWILARWCAASGHTTAAISHLRAFLLQCPNHTEAAVRLGVLLVGSGRTAAGAAALQRALHCCHLSEAQAAALLRELGELARGAGDLAQAVMHFRDAAALQPDDGALHNWLGIALLESGDMAAALAALDRALALGCAQAHTNLGICHYRRGDLATALPHFEAAAAKLPDDAAAQQNLAQWRAALPLQPAAV